jgi:hypothetical protein
MPIVEPTSDRSGLERTELERLATTYAEGFVSSVTPVKAPEFDVTHEPLYDQVNSLAKELAAARGAIRAQSDMLCRVLDELVTSQGREARLRTQVALLASQNEAAASVSTQPEKASEKLACQHPELRVSEEG